MDTLLEEVVAHIRAGNIETAKPLLIEFLKQNPNHEDAWLWMSRCVTETEQKRFCFEKALKINPQNQHAIRGLERLNNPISPKTQPRAKVVQQQQPVKKKGLNAMGIIALLGLAVFLFGVCGIFIIFMLNPSGPSAQVLSAEDTFEVSAIDVVKDEGYTVTSAVCEVVSSERYTVQGYDFGKIVFHAFRINKPTLGEEAVVLFHSNHTAKDGSGLVHTVNSLANTLFPDFPDASLLKHPINMDTPGAQEALECAQQAGKPPSINMGDFDPEAWRSEAIKRFGPEQTFDDGSKDDYVRLAFSICEQSNSERQTMLTNLGADYEGSFQQFIIETFCPYVK